MGRCLWGLGTAAAHSDVGMVRQMAVGQFKRAAQQRSIWPRAMAFAVLGAAELLSAQPGHSAAHSLITDYVAGVPAPTGNPDWPWPEPRLTYANAVLAEAMIAAGVAIDDSALYNRGLDLLAWLVERGDGRRSPVGHARRWLGHRRPSAGIRPATDRGGRTGRRVRPRRCCRSERHLARNRAAAAAWFQGANDVGELMWDPETGGGFDGLHADGVNRNQGAESTLAALSTFLQAQRFSHATP